MIRLAPCQVAVATATLPADRSGENSQWRIGPFFSTLPFTDRADGRTWGRMRREQSVHQLPFRICNVRVNALQARHLRTSSPRRPRRRPGDCTMELTPLRRWVGSLGRTRHADRAKRRRPSRLLNLNELEIRAVPAGIPELLKNVNAGTLGSSPEQITSVGNMIFFTARDNDHGRELWKTNGKAAGTAFVKDIRPGTGGSYPEYLTSFRGALYFVANDGTNGRELWRSDGTEAGTVLVKDINPGSSGSNPFNLTVIGRTLFFSATDAANGTELWKSDGTAAGTVLVKDIRPGSAGSNPSYHTVVKGTLYFTANDGVTGVELWKSDGTVTGTVLVKDIRPGNSPYGYPFGSNPRELTDVGDRLFFSADDGVTGRELWRSNGRATGTVLVKDIFPGSSPYGSPYGSNPEHLAAVGGRLFFAARDPEHGVELWKSDGTARGTVLVADIRPGSSPDGSPYGSYPVELTAAKGKVLFAADDGEHGQELWVSNGTARGTDLVRDIRPGDTGSFPDQLVEVKGTLFFTADDGVNGREVWKSNGRARGTALVKDINPGSAGSYPASLTDIRGTLYFSADDGFHGQELWKSNGTAAGTVLVADVNLAGLGSNPNQFVGSNGITFFVADDGLHGSEVWKSDGTEAGTVLLKDMF